MSTSSLDQLELQLEELEASADPHAAEQKFSAPWRRKPGSQLTRRWSKADSNSESHPRATPPAATRFVADSALEGAGFEPSVPR